MRRFEQAQGGGGRPARTATLVSTDAEAAALDELREALQRTPREVPCKYLYDDRGSALFEQITRLPEYYPTRTERALLLEQAGPIVEAAGGARLSEMVELGSGAASKTVALLDAALRLGGSPRYVAGARRSPSTRSSPTTRRSCGCRPLPAAVRGWRSSSAARSATTRTPTRSASWSACAATSPRETCSFSGQIS